MPSHPMMDLDHLSFEVEGFDWRDDRLELRGRWFGVHGRRFVRPTLHARADSRRPESGGTARAGFILGILAMVVAVASWIVAAAIIAS